MHDMPALDILNPDVCQRSAELRSEFTRAAPFPHIVIDNFLNDDFAHALLATFPAFERGNSVGDDGKQGGKSTVDRIKALGPAYSHLDEVIRSREFLDWLGRLTGIDALLYDPWYLGGGTHENRNGMSLDAHVDFNYHPSERWHRRLNLILYLNPLWEEAWGGSLQLFGDPHADTNPSSSVVPLFNRCVVFETSEYSWHGFNAIRLPDSPQQLTRRSIALYFYTKKRPADEVAQRHTTFYVNRQLPERFAEGMTLSENDVAEIRQLIEVRDAHIRLLYAENTELRAAQDKGIAGNLLYLAKRAYVRFRR